ncbi:MAG: glucosaminidase domain-containing protein [Alicyclobacillus mali]|uniref:glucosaminidase domain-containing protein n=1 Tax=Alicyclobacillus mali (ex Roth et al. 2021) TaxID=1123961 RepID=UPI0023F05BA0|nr:glucosaminidase domain-containing protein [Alicyclobacillus mali (ex Roth et al. 2021)]MCL6487379.1 glucosaminidase domain-containing protein [Alicyclobacillus mali (ex Roth et al. 2021)]
MDLGQPAPNNVTADAINQYLTDHSFVAAGLGSVFLQAQATYGVDANYLVSHAMEETGVGVNTSSIAIAKNNLYGYGAFDANASQDAGTFPSEAYAILFQAWEVRNNYLNPGASHYVSPTLAGMADNYASDPQWANQVNNLMDQFALYLHDTVHSYPQYDPSQPVTPPPAGSAALPQYRIAGATATIGTDAAYGRVIPVYADAASGQNHMFTRTLSIGDQGADVEILQRALNQQMGTNIATDGQFGPKTQSLLEQYQTAHGLPATGTCDFHLWDQVLDLSDPLTTVTSGQTVEIDAMAMGMAGSTATLWDHIPDVGWVDANDITFQNVVRLSVSDWGSPSAVQIPVYDGSGDRIATLHAGDYVVRTAAADGQQAIQFTNPATGAVETGYVPASVTLTPVSR